MQGDDLRHLDWSLYARLDETYIKLFHEQEELTIHLVVDTSRSMAFGSPPKLLTAAQIAAALGYIALCSYDRVCIEGVGGATQRLTPCRGKASARRLLAFMNDLEADGETHLEAALRAYVLRTRARGVAVLVSDLFDEAGFEAAVKRMQAPGMQGCVVHVLAREELEPDVSGDLRLLDSETGAHTDISASPALLARYRRNVQSIVEEQPFELREAPPGVLTSGVALFVDNDPLSRQLYIVDPETAAIYETLWGGKFRRGYRPANMPDAFDEVSGIYADAVVRNAMYVVADNKLYHFKRNP